MNASRRFRFRSRVLKDAQERCKHPSLILLRPRWQDRLVYGLCEGQPCLCLQLQHLLVLFCSITAQMTMEPLLFFKEGAGKDDSEGWSFNISHYKKKGEWIYCAFQQKLLTQIDWSQDKIFNLRKKSAQNGELLVSRHTTVFTLSPVVLPKLSLSVLALFKRAKALRVSFVLIPTPPNNFKRAQIYVKSTITHFLISAIFAGTPQTEF